MNTNYEAVGLFYAASLILFTTIGVGIGFALNHIIVYGILGSVTGIGFGLLSHGILALKEK